MEKEPIEKILEHPKIIGKYREEGIYTAIKEATEIYKCYIRSEETKTPWFKYKSNEEWHQCWFDDVRSLSLKYDFAIDQRLKGVGFWHLGFEFADVYIAWAIETGLHWLKEHQNPDGSWSYITPWGYEYESVGLTALAITSFLNYGKGENDLTVRKGLDFILSYQQTDGSITNGYPIYDTSLSVLALLATGNTAYKDEVQSAVNFLIQAQNDEGEGYSQTDWFYGGWGYEKEARAWADMSNTQFVLLALHEADQKGWINVSDDVWNKALIFVSRCQNLKETNPEYAVFDDGGFVYNPVTNPWLWGAEGEEMRSYGSMTAAGLWSLKCCKLPNTDKRVKAALDWLANHFYIDQNYPVGNMWLYYYQYTLAKALTLAGIEKLNGHDWYKDLSKWLIKAQKDDGSWLNPWTGLYHGLEKEVMATSQAILSLETKALPIVTRSIIFRVDSPADLHVYDSENRHVGINYETGEVEIEIPAATYTGPGTEPQIITILDPVGTYRIEMVGKIAGDWTLTIQGFIGAEMFFSKSYTGHIIPGQIYQSTATVSAIAGAITITTTAPCLQTDTAPPKTILFAGSPQYIDSIGNFYVTSATPFSLTAVDNGGAGSGVATTGYRIHNATYNTGWVIYSTAFNLTGFSDGPYNIDFNSTDNAGNVEPTNTVTVILDNTPPVTTLTIGEPKNASDTVYVTPDTPFTLEAVDTGSGVFSTAYRIFNANYDSGWQTYTEPFNLAGLADGVYTIEFNSTDKLGNVETTNSIQVTAFSWNYIFTDSYGRGTVLKISLAHKLFQFITPDKDYGIREATYMRQWGRTIIIQHCDNELRLITAAVDTKLNFCVAIAWDQQTCKRYFLIDKVGKE
ncbi:MAG: prenyltransferase/squalene oxidase repeat-containing protein [Candidatus Bathyarchaeia archaeon]